MLVQSNSEGLKSFGHLDRWELERLSEEETLEDSVRREGEDGHEHVGDHGSNGTTAYGSGDRGGYLERIRALGDHQEAVEATEATNEEHSEDHVDRSDGAHCTETSSVHEDQTESLHGTGAEPGVGQGHLDVGVLSQELNALLEAPEAVASNTEDDLDDLVLSGPSLNVLSVVLEQESDHLADGNQQSTEGDRAQMLGQHPLDGGKHGGLDQGVGFNLEEPDAGGASNNELATSDDEGVHPEESEYLVEEDVSGSLVPLDFSHELEAFTRLRLSYREDPEDSSDPGSNPE